MLHSIRRFAQSLDFYKSLILVTAVLVPLGLFYQLGQITVGISLAIGVFLCSFSDVPGSRRRRVYGILIASGIATVTTLFINLAMPHGWLVAPVLAALVFINAMFAVYGFRASLVSFSGLLAIVLAFSRPVAGVALIEHLALMLAGGVWYLLISTLAYRLTARRHNIWQLAECMRLTADYLRLRAEMQALPEESLELQTKLFQVQRELNALHERLREIFLSARLRSGASYSASRPILIFIELIDVLELAMSEPADYRRLREGPGMAAEAPRLVNALFLAMAGRLHALSDALEHDRSLPPDERLETLFAEAEQTLDGCTGTGAVSLQNWLEYAEKQRRKIESIERVMNNMAEEARLPLEGPAARRFITRQEYDLRILQQNLSERSPIFRHAVRLTVTVLIGYGLGMLLPVQNAYWILLTIMVIMRPNYGLTKERSHQRVIGTLIGGFIAAGIVWLTQNTVLYMVLAIVSLVFGISLTQRNYRTSAVFITLSIVFLYALIQPDAFLVIQYRVVDTVIGAALSFLAGLFLWPSWEIANIRTEIAEAIRANGAYLREISDFYLKKGELPVSYKLSRKDAFLANGNLSAAFQRMTQEPKWQQHKLSDIYEMVVLSHTFLNAAAALGTFIQHHWTTPRSGHFEAFIESILADFKAACAILRDEPPPDPGLTVRVAAAEAYLTDRQTELSRAAAPSAQPAAATATTTPEVLDQLQEVRLVADQLRWLRTIAGNVREVAGRVRGDG